ncbi:DUF177 domain-containing protein [Nevskia sp.]|uniref:YceD family protein n=1 Tax=Nevskia sp. TaxID=1929292 RepID=UPI0025D70F91|nr:DUF177 domain-containing protein [Nevskia sp.]
MNEPVKKTAQRILPLHAKVSSALTREASYAGSLPVSRLERLKQALADLHDTPQTDLQVELQLRRDKTRAPKLEGRVQGELTMTCQRCLKPFQFVLDAAIDLRLVFNEEEENRVLKDAEPYLVEDDQLPFHVIVEEEVLLALPFSARCERDDCTPL